MSAFRFSSRPEQVVKSGHSSRVCLNFKGHSWPTVTHRGSVTWWSGIQKAEALEGGQGIGAPRSRAPSVDCGHARELSKGLTCSNPDSGSPDSSNFTPLGLHGQNFSSHAQKSQDFDNFEVQVTRKRSVVQYFSVFLWQRLGGIFCFQNFVFL